MRIEAQTKLILTIARPDRQKESVEALLLAAEQHINKNGIMIMTGESKTHVGIRVHVQKGKEIK